MHWRSWYEARGSALHPLSPSDQRPAAATAIADGAAKAHRDVVCGAPGLEGKIKRRADVYGEQEIKQRWRVFRIGGASLMRCAASGT